MKPLAKSLLCLLAAATLPAAGLFADLDNPNIDMPGFLQAAGDAAAHRQTHRVSEDEFIRLSREPGTIILDARSREKYDLLHVAGAINLSFPDIDIESLRKTLPDKSACILIYCNNNFSGAPLAFASKAPATSLNLSTYVTLYTYGYRNVYELAPYIDVHKTKLNLISPATLEWIRTHQLSEEEFLRWSREPGTVVLDTSTQETYRWLHLAGAVHLPRREINAEVLERVLPDPHVRILLYENNNNQAFISQREMAKATNELGVPLVGEWSGDVERTCQLLREHGYRNLYALASYVRVDRSSLPSVAGMSIVDLEQPISLSLNREAR